jgi:Predicted xylanase/chitin deacetylase
VLRSLGRRAVLRSPKKIIPPIRFLLPSVLLVALLAMLVLRGLLGNEVFHDERVAVSVDKTTVPSKFLHGGPVIDAREVQDGVEPRSYSAARRTVALTFDDGPDPRWTPQILDILAEHHAKATFFVTGSMVSRNPELIRRIVKDGHEIGLHTFTHADLTLQSDRRIQWELAQTQLALAGVTGMHSRLFRPPYSSDVTALDDWTWPVVKKVGAHGYVTALIDPTPTTGSAPESTPSSRRHCRRSPARARSC